MPVPYRSICNIGITNLKLKKRKNYALSLTIAGVTWKSNPVEKLTRGHFSTSHIDPFQFLTMRIYGYPGYLFNIKSATVGFLVNPAFVMLIICVVIFAEEFLLYIEF